MTLWRLTFKEIRMRKLNFAMGLLSIVLAIGVLVAELTMLKAHDLNTTNILQAKQAETEEEMRLLEDDYRKIMKKLGFNLLILPEGQRLDDFYAEGYAARTMPEAYVDKLARSGIVAIRHLLPSLEQKIRWAEQGQRPIILVGTRGEVPRTDGVKREPMMIAVDPDTAVLGHEIWDSLGLKSGDTFTLLGREFTVEKCRSERGNKDDVTIWIDLAQAQTLLNQPGEVNAILALKCHCAGAELDQLRQEVNGILPGVQIIELENKVITRAEARDRAKVAAKIALQAEKDHRTKMRAEREAFAAWLVPLVLLGSAAWIGLLAFMNVRERVEEIGILRTLGLSARAIVFVFLLRALVIGLLGALIGYGIGFAAGCGGAISAELFSPLLTSVLLPAAPLLAMLASLPPAMLAAAQDPAIVLQKE